MDDLFASFRVLLVACLAASGVLFGTVSSQDPQRSPNLEPERPCEDGGFVGKARLWTDRDTVSAGDTCDCLFEFECHSGSRDVHYPLFPGTTYRILVFDSSRAHLGECGPSVVPAVRSKGKRSEVLEYPKRVLVSSGDAFGICVSIPTGDQTRIDGRDGAEERYVRSLGPGKYILQGVFTDRLVWHGPFRPASGTSSSPAAVWSNWLRVTVANDEESGTENDEGQSSWQAGRFKAFLTAEPQRVKMGDDFFLRIRCVNTSKSAATFFNPFIADDLNRVTADLYVFAESGTYLGECLHRPWGSSRLEQDSDWMPVQPGGIFGTRFRMTAGVFPFRTARQGEQYDTLPGRYDFQAAYLDPEDADRILARSKKVRVEYVEASDE